MTDQERVEHKAVDTIRCLAIDGVQAGQQRAPGHADGDGAEVVR